MILNPILGTCLRSTLLSCIKQTRNVRPAIKIGKEKFQITIDVHQFTKDEIRVKARPEYVIIEGKQERKTKSGYVLRHFMRKFKLPKGCNPSTMQSSLSPDGMLTITAPRKFCEMNFPCETVVPISFSEQSKGDESLIEVQEKCIKVTDESKEKKRKP